MFKATIIIIILLNSFNADADPKDHETWSLAIHGGGGCASTFPEFYRDLKLFDHKMQDFNVPNDKRISLFGFLENGTHKMCTSDVATGMSAQDQKISDKKDEDLQALIKKFVVTPAALQCGMVKSILKLALEKVPTPIVSPQNLDASSSSMRALDDSGSIITGPADQDFIQKEFAHLNSGLKNGDHLYLNLEDHGLMLDKSLPENIWKASGVKYSPKDPVWLMSLGNEKQSLTVDELINFLKPIAAKGAMVHVDVNTCFSGGFTQLTTALGGNVCVTTVTDKDHVGTEGPGGNSFLLSYETSQLKSFGCALANHKNDRPTTSLDSVIERWESSHKSSDGIACSSPEKELSVVSDMANELMKNSTEKLRSDVTRVFQLDYLQSYKDCFLARGDLHPPQPHPSGDSPELRFFSKAKSCIDSSKVSLTKLEKYLVSSSLNEMNITGDYSVADEHYPAQEIARHLKFLKSADDKALKEYKSSLCCLDYDAKNNSFPEMCNK